METIMSINGSAAIPLARIPLAHSPVSSLLAEAKNSLCDLGRRVGITWYVNFDMTGLIEVNDRAMSGGSWDKILPAADYRCRHLDRSNAYWIDGRNSDGETVTVQAGLLYDCSRRSIGERFADLTVSYDDPATQAPAGEWCTVTSEIALSLHGQIVWMNAGWTHPDWRRGKRGLFRTAQRVNRLAAWMLWSPDAFVGVVEPHILPVWQEKHMGHRYMDPETSITYRMADSGEFPMHFMLLTRAHFFGDLATLTVQDAAVAA
ncbi:hypothetical protein FW320_06595 [Azospirillum sp. Vi22]|uniref:hypothetical protein n=1 Tax=Azospirillum baldaniorum TaxID=1064539 RepID=UPI00157AD12A|nr:hypothetical protein [Azospirillum baldaniorum]NUB05844.1 hypothetical protein [Azospirillum baldaniorum]